MLRVEQSLKQIAKRLRGHCAALPEARGQPSQFCHQLRAHPIGESTSSSAKSKHASVAASKAWRHPRAAVTQCIEFPGQHLQQRGVVLGDQQSISHAVLCLPQATSASRNFRRARTSRRGVGNSLAGALGNPSIVTPDGSP